MSHDEEPPPPPYSATPAAHSRAAHSGSASLFQSQLSGLRGFIIEEQAVRGSLRDQEDSEILSLLVPHIEELLESIAAIHPPPSLVEATLVPDGAIGRSWRFSDAEETQTGEMRKLIRVTRRGKLDGEKKQQHAQSSSPPPNTSGRGFDEWGRWTEEVKGSDSPHSSKADLWWSDEDMARRLARHLQPARATPSVDRAAVTAQVERARETRRAGRWSLFTRDDASHKASPPARQQTVDDVEMNVAAEEVTFRRQNEMGLWQSKTGWGVVVRVSIRQA